MKKSKTAIIIVLLILFFSIFFFFFPLNEVAKNLPIVKVFYRNTVLEVTSPNSKALVKIDGKEYGSTPVNITNLVAGEYQIEMIKESSSEGFYKPHIFNIWLTKNSTSRINMEIGPDDNLHGFELYYTEDNTGDVNMGKLTLTSNASDTKAYIDNEYINRTPITNHILNKGEYTIKMESEGYEDLEFPVVVSEGHILHIKGHQFPIPVSFDIN